MPRSNTRQCTFYRLKGVWLCVAWLLLASQVAFASGTQTYRRTTDDPYDNYNFASVEQLKNTYRDQGGLSYDQNGNVTGGLQTGHPRIFITPANRSAIASKIGSDAFLRSWMQDVVDRAEGSWNANYTDAGGNSNEPDGQPAVLANAMICQIGTSIAGVNFAFSQQEYCDQGVSHLQDLAAIDTFYNHEAYLGLPLGYDWLYQEMTTAERNAVAARLVQYGQNDARNVEPHNGPPGMKILGGLALYGDGYDDAEALRIINLFHGGAVFGEPADADMYGNLYANITQNHIIVPEGPGSEGFHYSRRYDPFYPFLLAWRDQTGEDYFQMPFFRNWVYHMTHITGNEYERWDKWSFAGSNPSWTKPKVNLFLELGLTPIDRNAAALSKYHMQQGTIVRDSYRVIYLLLSDSSVTPRSPSALNLPLVHHFEGANNIFGRNSWADTSTTWSWFESPTWTFRDGGPTNDVLIWKNGGMLLGKHEQQHDYDGGNRTNTINFYDSTQPGITFLPHGAMDRSTSYKLGLRPHRGDYLRNLNRNLEGYHEGLRFFEFSDRNFLYAFGDGAQTFDNTNSDGSMGSLKLDVDDWTRQYVWFRDPSGSANPQKDHIVVFDRVGRPSANIREHLRWNFNMPLDIRDKDTNQNLGNGTQVRQGHWTYTNANRIVHDNTVDTGGANWGQANARLYVDTVFPPQSVTYHRMGGVAERNIDIFGNLRQDRLRVTGDPNSAGNIVQGMWRVQVESRDANANQTYLHWFQATDTGDNNPARTYGIQGSNLMGAAAAGNMVLFSAVEGAPTSRSAAVPAGLNGTHRILIADLEPGASYDVSIGSNQFNGRTASQAGTIWLASVSVSASETISILRTGSSPPINQPPTVDAGPNGSVTLPSIYNLDGTVSDDGLPNPPGSVTTTWSRASGPGTVTFGNPSAVDTTAQFSVDGTYVLRLTANDSALSASDTITVTVNPAGGGNQPPTVDAGVDQTITLPSAANLDATVSDPNGDSFSVQWDRVSGPGTVTFGDSQAVDTTAAFSVDGSYTLRLTATDSNNASSSDTATITVNPAGGGGGNSNVLAEWRFDETSGLQAADSTGNGHNGTLINGPVWSTGRVGNALTFDGVDDRVEVADHTDLQLGNRGSISWWQRLPVDPADDISLVHKGTARWSSTTDYHLFVEGGSVNHSRKHRLLFRAQDGTNSNWRPNYRPVLNTWEHFAFTWDGTTINYYVNGALSESRAQTHVPRLSSGRVTIGQRFDQDSFIGDLDSLCLFDGALLASEVSRLVSGTTCDSLGGGGGDNQDPTISIVSPTNGATVSSTIPVTANASDNVGVAGVQFLLDGANLGPEDTISPYSVSWDTTTSSNGSHVLSALARDAAGNTGAASPVTVTVNNVGNLPPTIDTFSHNGTDLDSARPLVQLPEGSSVTVSASASDPDADILSWTFFESIDGGAGSQMDTGTQPPTTIRPQTITIGSANTTHRIVLHVSDGNNPTVTREVTFEAVDVSPPVITNIQVSNPTASSFTVTWTTDEPATSQVEYGLDTSYGNFTPENPTLVTNHTMVVSGLTEDTLYNFRVISRDASGNVARSPNNTGRTSVPPELCVQVPLEGRGTDQYGISRLRLRVLDAARNVILDQSVATDMEGFAYIRHSSLAGLSPAADYHLFAKAAGFFQERLLNRRNILNECQVFPEVKLGDLNEDGVSDLSDLAISIQHFRGDTTHAILQELYGQDFRLRHIVRMIINYVSGEGDRN